MVRLTAGAVCLRVAWLSILFVPVGAASAGTAADPAAPLEVRLQAVYVTDAGSRTFMSVDGNMVRQWVDQVNGVYAQAKIRFLWDYMGDLTAVESAAAIDQTAWAARPAVTNSETGKELDPPPLREDYIASIARKYPGKLVVVFCIVPEMDFPTSEGFVTRVVPGGEEQSRIVPNWQPGQPLKTYTRKAPDRVVTEKTRVTVAVVQTFREYTNVQSGKSRYIVLASVLKRGAVVCDPAVSYEKWQGLVMAHEIGHYLGLRHTFSRRFPGLSEAGDYLKAHGKDESVFDGDGLADTPADPGIDAVRCRETGSPFTIAGTLFLVSRNLMSYSRLFASEGPQLTPSQISIVRGHVRSLGLDVRGLNVEGLSSALERAPEHIEARYERAMKFLARGDFRGAGADFEKLAAVKPDDVEVMAALGLVSLHRFDLARALTCAEQALRAQPGSAAALVVRAAIRRARGEDDLGAADVERARVLNAASAETWRDRTVLGMNELGEAGMTAGRALQILHGRLGGRAEDWAVLARTIAGQDRTFREVAGLYEAKSYEPALVRCQAGLKGNAWQWKLWQMAGNCRLALGDPAGALTAYHRSLELHPGNEDLKRFCESMTDAGSAPAP